MKLISTITVGAGGTTAIDFTGIPQTGTDLVLVLSCRGTGAGNNYLQLQANNLTSGYETRIVRGENGGATSASGTSVGLNNIYWVGMTGGSNLTANSFTNVYITIPNYTSTMNKTMSAEYAKETNDGSAFEVGFSTGSVNLTSAITSIKLTLLLNGATFAQNTSASLYTVTKGSGGASVA